MRNLWLITSREYLVRVRTRAFLVFTILMPLLVSGLVVLPAMMMVQEPSIRRVAIVAGDGRLAATIQNELVGSHASADPGEPASLEAAKPQAAGFEVSLAGAPSEELRQRLADQLRQNQLDGVLWIDRDVLTTRQATYYARAANDFVTEVRMRRALRDALGQLQLAGHGFSASEARALLGPVSFNAVHVDRDGARNANGLGAFFLPFVLLFAIYFTVLVYGIYVMRSVIEEKSSRVMEVLLGSVSPMQLMAGKIIGVGAVGLTQILLWALAGIALNGHASAAHLLGDPLRDAHIASPVLVLFPVFFLLGYATYACLYAAIGAMVNSDEEASQYQFPITLPLLLCIVFATAIINNPNSSLAFWLSLFPLTSPIIMFVRVSVSTPPTWQIALSIWLSLCSLYGLVWLSSRIYRVGILMYGKRPTLQEVLKWLRYV